MEGRSAGHAPARQLPVCRGPSHQNSSDAVDTGPAGLGQGRPACMAARRASQQQLPVMETGDAQRHRSGSPKGKESQQGVVQARWAAVVAVKHPPMHERLPTAMPSTKHTPSGQSSNKPPRQMQGTKRFRSHCQSSCHRRTAQPTKKNCTPHTLSITHMLLQRDATAATPLWMQQRSRVPNNCKCIDDIEQPVCFICRLRCTTDCGMPRAALRCSLQPENKQTLPAWLCACLPATGTEVRQLVRSQPPCRGIHGCTVQRC
jgi:hypothetical protein